MLSALSDISMAVLGGSLKRKERLSARLGDILSQLYLSSATLKRYESDGRITDDLPLVHWGLQDSLKQTEHAIDEFLANFPNKWLGKALRVLILPYGRVRKAPSDKLDSQVARILQTPSETRSRIGRHQYLTASEFNPAGKIEQALNVVLEAEPVFDKICKALGERRPFLRLDLIAEIGLEKGLIDNQEASLLREAEVQRLYVINVDDFEPQELAAKPREVTPPTMVEVA